MRINPLDVRDFLAQVQQQWWLRALGSRFVESSQEVQLEEIELLRRAQKTFKCPIIKSWCSR